VIAHFGIIETAYRAANGIQFGDRTRMPVLNTSINRFAIGNGEIRMLTWGEAEHLEPLRKPADYIKHF
jgi:2,3-bisphosphoglycerate-dependent phosphoglycerate mutase